MPILVHIYPLISEDRITGQILLMHKLKRGKYLVTWNNFSEFSTSIRLTPLHSGCFWGLPMAFALEPVSYQTIHLEPVHTIPGQ